MRVATLGSEYWKSRIGATAALLGLAGVGLGLTATPAAAVETGSISGVVTAPDAADPHWSEGVVVWAYNDEHFSQTRLGADGSYTVSDLEAGSYVVEYLVSGHYDSGLGRYVDVNLVPEYYNDALTYSGAERVAVGDGEAVLDIDAELAPGGTISGVVSAPGSANPEWWRGVVVEVSLGGKASSAALKSDGTYSIPRLAPGSYTVAFYVQKYYDSSRGDYVDPGVQPEFYDDADGEADAKPVKVGAREAIAGVNAELAASATISGTVTAPGAADLTWWKGVHVTASGDAGYAFVPLAEDGTYDITGLAPGSYVVSFGAGSYSDATHQDEQVNLLPEYYPDVTDVADAEVITVGSGDHATRIDAELAVGGSISGIVTAPAAADANWWKAAYVTVASENGAAGQARVNEDGTYTIIRLAPGRYSVQFDVSYYYDEIAGGSVWVALESQHYRGAIEPSDEGAVEVGGGEAVTGIDAVLAVKPLEFDVAPRPAISGSPSLGATLAVNPGTWVPAAELSYQWFRAGAPILGATGPTYTTVVADAGEAITVVVTGAKVAYETTARSSLGFTVNRGAFSTSPSPAISGGTTAGSVLTAKPGSWSPTPDTLSYQWYRSGAAISGATKSTYTLTTADRGKKVTVKVTGRKAGYTTVTKTSKGTYVPNVFTTAPVPTISGGNTAGAVLTAKPGTWSPAATLTYQWYRGTSKISGATKSTYTLTKADRGTKVTVKVTGSKSGYTSVTKTSAAKAIPNVFTAAPTPTITGTAVAGRTLTAKPGTWSPSATLTYQWYRGTSKISGATKSTYTLTRSDTGKKVTVKVTGKKSGYLTVTKASAAEQVAS
ncbi:hypothetical protein [Demequina soli]|uniref:hypothetical protein n=1 Tax=Demequina soli TaxID=1638987 RepID=UPI000785244F|nr:hypothetical protein [Demequina soli]